MKNFMQIHDITQNVQGHLKYMAVTKIKLPCPGRDIEGKLYVDEVNGNVWVYNPNGWRSVAEATSFAFNLLLHPVPPVYGGQKTVVSEEPKMQTRNVQRHQSFEDIQTARAQTWYKPEEVRYKSPFETMYEVPKRKVAVTEVEDNSEAVTGQLREPANRQLMEQLKKCITKYSI